MEIIFKISFSFSTSLSQERQDRPASLDLLSLLTWLLQTKSLNLRLISFPNIKNLKISITIVNQFHLMILISFLLYLLQTLRTNRELDNSNSYQPNYQIKIVAPFRELFLVQWLHCRSEVNLYCIIENLLSNLLAELFMDNLEKLSITSS